ncbi:hypothetical protein AB0945_40985, partial [Streptomyces sp. NPDC005474]
MRRRTYNPIGGATTARNARGRARRTAGFGAEDAGHAVPAPATGIVSALPLVRFGDHAPERREGFALVWPTLIPLTRDALPVARWPVRLAARWPGNPSA